MLDLPTVIKLLLLLLFFFFKLNRVQIRSPLLWCLIQPFCPTDLLWDLGEIPHPQSGNNNIVFTGWSCGAVEWSDRCSVCYAQCLAHRLTYHSDYNPVITGTLSATCTLNSHPTHSSPKSLTRVQALPLIPPPFVRGLYLSLKETLTTDKMCHLRKHHHCYSVSAVCQGAYFKWIVWWYVVISVLLSGIGSHL